MTAPVFWEEFCGGILHHNATFITMNSVCPRIVDRLKHYIVQTDLCDHRHSRPRCRCHCRFYYHYRCRCRDWWCSNLPASMRQKWLSFGQALNCHLFTIDRPTQHMAGSTQRRAHSPGPCKWEHKNNFNEMVTWTTETNFMPQEIHRCREYKTERHKVWKSSTATALHNLADGKNIYAAYIKKSPIQLH